MSVRRFFVDTVTIRRYRTVSGHRKAFQATATVDVHIQALDRESRSLIDTNQDRVWVAYFDAEGFEISIGDQVEDKDGNIYKVIEYTPKDYQFGINRYKEVILVEYND